MRRILFAIGREILRGSNATKAVVDPCVRALLAGAPEDQDFRVARYKASYGGKVRRALERLFPVLACQLGDTAVADLAASFCEVGASRSPMLVDLRGPLQRFLARVDVPYVAELLALDDASHQLTRRVGVRPRRRAAVGPWVNPNVVRLRSKLPLDRIWFATQRSTRVRLRRSATPATFAVLVARSGVIVTRLTSAEVRVLDGHPTRRRLSEGALRRSIAALAEKAIFLGDVG